ncbi:MAG: TonB-dependent receptor [Bacteroidetes bacterium]|nr:MAG: TonB-dependent receptor [Bacteroidota bacterium]
MKRIASFIISVCLSQFVNSQEKEITQDSFYLLTPVEVRAIRAGENSPFTKSNISKKTLEKINTGVDIPFLLNQTPGVVVNSDAGNGIGYTGIRIRGTDASRINVTLNGVPFNDAESQGSFFVDLPDFSSSTGSVQIQRGVGTSSNGAGAFGASINFSTNEVNDKPYFELNNSAGSFNSFKNTLKIGSGLIAGHFTTDLRLSRISSDGFIDRASSNLKSIYFSTAYINKKSSLRLNIFSGKEKTYQAWYGISEADLIAGNRTVNYAGTERPNEPYDNETDNYKQDHYQFFFNHKFSSKFNFSTALFLIKGKGYYEQYKADEDYADYDLPYPDMNTTTSDLVRQLWLDNDYYGNIFSLNYKDKASDITLGGAVTQYDGNHFGKVIWAEEGLPYIKNYYDLDAVKKDFNIYLKQQTRFADYWHFFYDLQFRQVNYDINGFRDNPTLIINNGYSFFNPKAGISFNKNKWKGYLSFAVANKEPNRDDFEASEIQQPKPEKLYDWEAGAEFVKLKWNISANIYYMSYKDQLVLSGKINDVGAYTRTNIPESYRKGIEIQGAYKFNKWINATANIALSKNKVENFTEYVDDYDNGGQQTYNYSSPDIALSPSVVSGGSLNILPMENWEISLPFKVVSKQYLDNTSNDARKLDGFYTQDLRTIYTIKGKKKADSHRLETSFIFQLNNILDEKYEPNGYTFSYIYGGSMTTENYYFPMAGRNFMISVNFKF